MGITEDQNNPLELLNINIFKNWIIDYFNNGYIEFEEKYKLEIQQNVLFENNNLDTIKHLENCFNDILNKNNFKIKDKLLKFNSIKIENNRFTYNLRELIIPILSNQLYIKVIPNLKYPLGAHGIDQWVNSIKNHAERVYIKHFIKQLIQNNKISNYNDIVFRGEHSEQFFNFLIDNWIINEPNQKTALDCIIAKMWYKSKEVIEGYNIKCLKTYFAEYWNDRFKGDEKFIQLDIKNPKFKDISTNEYYINKFNSLKEKFERNEVKGD